MIKTKKAITLVEILIYLALFGVVFTIIVQFYIGVTQTNKYAEDEIDISNDILFIQSHLASSEFEAVSINETESIMGDDIGSVRFTFDSGYVDYYLQNGNLLVDRDGNVTQLSNNTLTVNQFRIDPIRIEGSIVSAIISLQLESNVNSIIKSSSYTVSLI